MFFDGMDRQYVGMVDRGGRFALAQESSPRRSAGGQSPVEHLDGHGPSEVGIEAADDDAHAAVADDFHQIVLSDPSQRRGNPWRVEDAQVEIGGNLGNRFYREVPGGAFSRRGLALRRSELV